MHENYITKPLTLDEVKKKGGAVGKLQGKKVAAYKEGDTIKAVSAICTHKHCIIQYDEANKDWLCPCHGARFALDGSVRNGPADAPLPKVDVKIEDHELKLVE